MKRAWVILFLATLLVACGGGSGGGEPAQQVKTDPDTGLPINPDLQLAQSGQEFIVEGRVESLNLTPQTKPEYLVIAESGTRYRVLGQPLVETFMSDGTPVAITDFRQGMIVRATAIFVASEQRYESKNITVLDLNP